MPMCDLQLIMIRHHGSTSPLDTLNRPFRTNSAQFQHPIMKYTFLALTLMSSLAYSADTTPYGGTPHVIPGVIEAEHFDDGAPEKAYHDAEPKNQGAPLRGADSQVDIESRADASNKHGVGWTRAGEWLVYTVDVKESGTYTLELVVASEKQGGTLHVKFNGTDKTGPIQIPDTGAWTKLGKISKAGIKLEKGIQTMKVVMDTESPESKSTGDIDLFKFTKE